MLFAMTVPALVLVLTVLGVIELVAHRRHREHPTGHGKHRGTAMSSTGFDLIEEVFNPGKRSQIEQRDHEALMYEEDGEGAPPRTRIDLDKGTAHVVLRRT